VTMNREQLEHRVQHAERFGTCKVNVVEKSTSLNGEGMWAAFASQQDADTYNKDSAGDEITVLLMNHSFQVKAPTWGAKVKCRTNGENRPTVFIDDLIEQVQKQADAGEYPAQEEFAE